MAKKYRQRCPCARRVTIGIVKDRIQQDDARDGFILDGFRARFRRRKAWTASERYGTGLDYVLNLEVADEVILRGCPAEGYALSAMRPIMLKAIPVTREHMR